MYTRRRHRQNLDSVAIGRYAGEESTTENTVSVGRKAGYSAQAQWAIAIGDRAGEETQGTNAIAIGVSAGKTAQGVSAIAIGTNAGSNNQPAYSIIISSGDSAITAANKGLYIDPIRNFDDRESRPATVKEGNVLSYNYQNNNENATKEVVTGFPRLPGYQNDMEVFLAFVKAKKNLSGYLLVTDSNLLSLQGIKKDQDQLPGQPWIGEPPRPYWELFKGHMWIVQLNDVDIWGNLRIWNLLTGQWDNIGIIIDELDAGTMYFDTSTKKVKVFTGTTWTSLFDEQDLLDPNSKLSLAITSTKNTPPPA